MKILIVHNSYQYAGGEDAVVKLESELLAANGESVKQFAVNNNGIKSIRRKIEVMYSVCYSKASRAIFLEKLKANKPNVVHVHNFFPLLTLSIYDACTDANVPVVQTLHNYRTICPGALLMRDGKICEKCVTGSPYQSVLHGCYRDSKLGTLAVARMVDYHRKQNTWNTKVNRFIALTEFAKAKFVEAGFDADKIAVKPNFIEDPIKPGVSLNDREKKSLFVGRISVEKGIATLVNAWQALKEPLNVAGEGPLLNGVISSNCNSHIQFKGVQTKEQVSELMLHSQFLVMPSECYETFGMVLIEAFAHGLPVLVSRIGAMKEIVEDGVTGVHFEAGNADDLAEKAQWLFDHPDECRRMGENARNVYLEKYTPEKNYQMLMQIYEDAIEDKKNNER